MTVYVAAIDVVDAEEMVLSGEWFASVMAAGATADQYTERAKKDSLPGPFKVFKVSYEEMP